MDFAPMWESPRSYRWGFFSVIYDTFSNFMGTITLLKTAISIEEWMAATTFVKYTLFLQATLL